MVDYVVEIPAGMASLRKLLRDLEDTEQKFALIMKDDMPSTALKEIFTSFLDNFEDVASVNDTDWDSGTLEVICTPAVIFAIIETDTLLEYLRVVTYYPPNSIH